jgi:hypothetical protein
VAELNVICWLWGSKYSAQDVLRLRCAVGKHLDASHRFIVFADEMNEDLARKGFDVRRIVDPLLIGRHCFCRLRMFDPAWQEWNKFKVPIVSLDLDLIITGRLDPLFFGHHDFMILQGVNAVNPNPFNASVMMLLPGNHAHVWNDFTMERAQKMRRYEFPDDQGWIWDRLPHAFGWRAGPSSGIYGFMKPGWPAGTNLPKDARIVAFLGHRKPHQFQHIAWVKKCWTELAA